MENETPRAAGNDGDLAASAPGKPLLTWEAIAHRWPHIAPYLLIDRATGEIEDYYFHWHFANEAVEYPNEEAAAALEEWADYNAWRLEKRLPALANDRSGRCFSERLADEIIYSHKREAAVARGEDPGERIPQHVRRPELYAELKEITDAILKRGWTRKSTAYARSASSEGRND